MHLRLKKNTNKDNKKDWVNDTLVQRKKTKTRQLRRWHIHANQDKCYHASLSFSLALQYITFYPNDILCMQKVSRDGESRPISWQQASNFLWSSGNIHSFSRGLPYPSVSSKHVHFVWESFVTGWLGAFAPKTLLRVRCLPPGLGIKTPTICHKIACGISLYLRVNALL